MSIFLNASKRALYAVIIAILLLAGAIIMIMVQNIRSPEELTPNITKIPESFSELTTDNLVEFLETKQMSGVEEFALIFGNSEEFVQDVENCSVITDITISEFVEGFWLSFLCAKDGDSLHPYFGYFQTENEKKVLWGEMPQAEIISETIQDGEKLLVVENMSDVPWSLAQTWLDFLGNEVLTSSPDKKTEIYKGDTAVFVLTENDNSGLLENKEHGYYLEIF